MNTSITLDPGNTEGFDEFAGRKWVYPNNMPIRPYQKQAVEKALFHNAMIVLPTGFGKTFIAAVVMYNFYHWYPRGKIIFVAPTKPLVAQQINECRKICGFPSSECVEMTGIMNREKRAGFWKTRRVFFATPQCIDNDLESSVIPAREVKLFIVDEAHKAQGGYAYVNIARQLHERNRNGFRLVALSATPGSDIEKVQQVMLNLFISDVMFRTENSIDLMPFKNEKNSHAWTVELTGKHLAVVNQFIKLTQPFYKELHRAGLTFNGDSIDRVAKWTVLKAMDQLRQNLVGDARSRGRLKFITGACSSLSHHFQVLTLYGLRPFYLNMKKTMSEKSSCVKTLLSTKSEFEMIMKDIEQMFGDDLEINPDKRPVADLSQGHPKLRVVKDLLSKHFKECEDQKRETRVMVFTTYRDSVYDIVQSLKRDEPIIKAAPFVGQGKGRSGDQDGAMNGMKQREQIQRIKEFKAGMYNVLVATCVAEEGLDIGEVDLIISYDSSASPISSVQRRGRTGRKRAGVVHTLCTKGYEEKKLKSAGTSRRTIEEQLYKRENYIDHRYRDAPRMVPSHIRPEFFPQRVEAAEEPELEVVEKPRRRRAKKATNSEDEVCGSDDCGKAKKRANKKAKLMDDGENNCNTSSARKRKSLLDSSDDEADFSGGIRGFFSASKYLERDNNGGGCSSSSINDSPTIKSANPTDPPKVYDLTGSDFSEAEDYETPSNGDSQRSSVMQLHSPVQTSTQLAVTNTCDHMKDEPIQPVASTSGLTKTHLQMQAPPLPQVDDDDIEWDDDFHL